MYLVDIDLPAKIKELRDNIDGMRSSETVSSSEMYMHRCFKNLDEIEAAITLGEEK